MPENSLPRTAILGAGLMGHGIAQVFGAARAPVTIWDPDPAALGSVKARIEAHREQLGENDDLEIKIATSLEDALSGAELVTEAAPERLALKRDLIRQIESVNRDCIIASNTSVLRITELAEGSRRPEQIVGTHWWNPPYLIPIVEVVRGERTDNEVMTRTTSWLAAAGKLPVEVLKDAPGFVGNRMQFALVREAAAIVEQGIATAETVDLVARHTFSRRWSAVGPLENSDYIGLDLVCAIMDYLLPTLSTTTQTPDLFTRLISEGRAGAVSGAGVFDWPPGQKAVVERRLLEHLLNQRQIDGS